MMEPIPIYKGDNTDAFGTRTICITLKTEVSLVGATAKFSLLSFSQSFPNSDVLAKKFTFSIPAETTRGFPLGLLFGKLVLTDSSGRTMTAACNIPFRVMLANGAMAGGCVQVRTPAFDVLVEMGVDYALAYNKPTINGVEVCGDREGRDYGLNRILDFSEASVYAVGDQVIHESRIFACKHPVAEPGAWDADKWDELGASELAKSAVHYIEDAGKTEEEKKQARKNIDAASTGDVKTVADELAMVKGRLDGINGIAEPKAALSSLKECVVQILKALKSDAGAEEESGDKTNSEE